MGQAHAIPESVLDGQGGDPYHENGIDWPEPGMWDDTAVVLPHPFAPQDEDRGYLQPYYEDRHGVTAGESRRQIDDEYYGLRPSGWLGFDDESDLEIHEVGFDPFDE